MGPDASLWKEVAQQLPALALSLGAFLYMIVRGMHFFTQMMTTFMRHQEGRDAAFLAGMNVLGEKCHQWGERREQAMTKAMEEHKAAMAKQEDAIRQLTSALERSH